MSSMLSTEVPRFRSLTEVGAECLLSLSGRSTLLPSARSVVLVVIDGLGAIQLRAHAGHARNLAGAMTRRDVIETVFPSTTVTALTSLLTGTEAGEHGHVGYRIRVPETGRLVVPLDAYDSGAIDPDVWQRSRTIFQRATGGSYAVGPSHYDGSGFTRAVLRGARYVSEDAPTDRVRLAYQIARDDPGSVIYCYLPEVDKAGHRYGVDSEQWRVALEIVDAACAVRVPDGVGVLITSDHGMIDVPRHRHVLLDEDDPRLAGVAHLGGEPRLLHLYCDPGAAERVAATWRAESGSSAEVITRAEATSSGLFGEEVADEVRERIGDVLVAARGLWAFYDDRGHDKRSQRMIGQHGSRTPEETRVPLIRSGVFRER